MSLFSEHAHPNRQINNNENNGFSPNEKENNEKQEIFNTLNTNNPKQEKRATMDQLFKNGDNFEFKRFDYGSEEASNTVKYIKEKRAEIQQDAEVNQNEANSIRFNI